MTGAEIKRDQKRKLSSFLRTAHERAWQDLKTRWKQGLFMVFCLFGFIGLCFALGISIAVTKTSSNLTAKPTACRPDGSFSLDPTTYNYWDSSGFFQVTLGFGDLSFTQAKAIDVVWDIVSNTMRCSTRLDVWLMGNRSLEEADRLFLPLYHGMYLQSMSQHRCKSRPLPSILSGQSSCIENYRRQWIRDV
jgi:hypothetical protein